MQRKTDRLPTEQNSSLDLDELLHPASAFAHPSDVVNDPDLTLTEKRAILASWASDACAVEAVPALRQPPGRRPVRFDDIMDALSMLDRQAESRYRPRPHYRRVLENRIPGVFGRKGQRHSNDDHGQSLH
ncbi:MAG: hypothetical protein QOG83_3328 [Alphaproteobacteria bacterium]|nr:hypothetical protein [Alphaproteobacteria bacterium]